MNKFFKSLFYIAACSIVFTLLVKVYGDTFPTNSAIAFEWEKQVNVYFGNANMGSSGECSKVFPVSRMILNAETFGPGSLEALLNGVSEQEKALGFFSSLNDKILVQKFEIKDKVAYVDFDARFNEGVSGSCRVTAIKSQIENTLNNLPDIDSVVISVNGKTDNILNP